MKAGRRYLNPFEHTTGLIYDQMVVLAGYYSHMNFDTPSSRIKFISSELIIINTHDYLQRYTIFYAN
jgi:hypothetical protein